MNEYVNKPVAFKRSDPIDAARYEFARQIPFTALVKEMIDNLMHRNEPKIEYRAFVSAPVLETRTANQYNQDEIVVDDTNQFL